MNVLKRGNPTLLGHIVLFEVSFSLPLFLFFLFTRHSHGTLTRDSAIYLAFLWAVGGAVVAVLFWFTFSLPLMKRRKGGGQPGPKSDS
jgi:predicted permease